MIDFVKHTILLDVIQRNSKLLLFKFKNNIFFIINDQYLTLYYNYHHYLHSICKYGTFEKHLKYTKSIKK